MDPAQTVTPRKNRSGSEKRKRPMPFPVRLSPQERAAIEAGAERAGLTLGTYIRSCVLAAPTTRACRRPSVEVIAATKLLGALNRIGGNLNQLARHANFGNVVLTDELGATMADIRAAVAVLIAAMGRAA